MEVKALIVTTTVMCLLYPVDSCTLPIGNHEPSCSSQAWYVSLKQITYWVNIMMALAYMMEPIEAGDLLG